MTLCGSLAVFRDAASVFMSISILKTLLHFHRATASAASVWPNETFGVRANRNKRHVRIKSLYLFNIDQQDVQQNTNQTEAKTL